MLIEAWLIRFGEVATDFGQRIAELESKLLPKTSPEVLEERWNVDDEEVQQI